MKLRTEAKIGIIVLTTLVLIIWGINYLKGKNIVKRTDVYYTVYNDAKGLEFAAPVYINGYKVGLINRIYFDGNDLNRIIVAIVVDKQYNIPKGSVAKISSADIMQGKSIEIELSGSSEYHSYGDTLLSVRDKDLLTKLQTNFDPIITDAHSALIQLDSLLGSLNSVLDTEGINNLQASLENINKATSSLNNQLSDNGNLNRSLKNLEKFSSTLSDSRNDIQKTINNIAIITDTLKNSGLGTTIEELKLFSEHLNELVDNINSGQGSLGKLVVNDSLHLKLLDVSENLDLLFQDMKENPKRYVHFSIFGRKDKK